MATRYSQRVQMCGQVRMRADRTRWMRQVAARSGGSEAFLCRFAEIKFSTGVLTASAGRPRPFPC